MGISLNGSRMLLLAKKSGISFRSIATIGRQALNVGVDDLRKNFDEFQLVISPSDLDRIFAESFGYAESLLRYLGSEEISSFDCSQYEGCNIVADFNVKGRLLSIQS